MELPAQTACALIVSDTEPIPTQGDLRDADVLQPVESAPGTEDAGDGVGHHESRGVTCG